MQSVGDLMNHALGSTALRVEQPDVMAVESRQQSNPAPHGPGAHDADVLHVGTIATRVVDH